jgi:hypothetical protein
MRSVRLTLPLVFAALAAACESPPPVDPGPQVPAKLEVVGGDDQQGVVGRELAQVLVVRVTDDKDKPVRGAIVNFRVTAGGGSVFAGASQTNENGEARERWTLGTATADSQRVEVRAVDATTGAALVLATFRATALPDAAEAVVALGPATRTGDAGHPMADSLAARVTDRYGNGVPGSVVVWSVTGGGGTVSPAQGTTDAQGVVRTSFTLGTRLDSLHTAEASLSPAVRAQFSATAGLPLGTQLSKVSGDGQDGGVGVPLDAPLVVRLALADGRPIVGATIVWSIASGEGTLTPPTSVTGADGQAQAAWRLGTRSGPQGVVATIQELTSIFTAAAAAGPPTTFVKVGGDDQAGYAGSALADSLAVRLADAYGNPVSGFMVTWSATRGGGSISPTQIRSGADGVARASWTLGTLLDNAHAAEASIGPATRVQFGAWPSLPMGATLTKVSGDGQKASVGDPLPAPLVVRMALPDGRPLVGAAVRWSIGTGAGSLDPELTVTDADGRAQTEWRLGTLFGPQGVVATHLSLSTIFSADAVAGPPAAFVKTEGDGQTGPAGSALADSLGVRVRDARGHPVVGATVTWSVLRGGGTVSPAQATTNADGVARARWTLGMRVDSIQSVVAETAPGLRLQFNAAAGVPVGAALTAVSGNGQTGAVGTVLPEPLVVAMRTAEGRGIVGASISFSAAPGSGTLTPASARTDANGQVQTTWTLGTQTGELTVMAGTAGVPSLTLGATAVTGPPGSLAVVSGNGQTGLTGKPMPAPLVVRVADEFGNPVAGAPVQWTVLTGGGSVAPAAGTTGADGTASTTWTLGATVGSQSIRASSGSLPVVTMTGTATAAQPPVTVVLPQRNQVVGDTLQVRARTDTPPASLRSLTAQVAGRVVNLAQAGTDWLGTMTLNGLPHGTLTLRVRAESVSGDTTVVDVPIIHDAPPVITVLGPSRGTVARPNVRLQAQCTDDGPAGCTRILVHAPYSNNPHWTVADGDASMDTTVSLALWDRSGVRLTFTAYDSRGQQTHHEVTPVYVEASPRWTEVASGGVLLLDYDDQRALFLADDGSARIGSRMGGGGETTLRGPDSRATSPGSQARGWLHPQGALFTPWGAVYSPYGTPGSFDWRNGTLHALGGVGSSLQAAGRWAIWRNAGETSDLFRRDLWTGATQEIGSAAGLHQSVAANGDVVFQNPSFDIMRYRGGVLARLTAESSTVANENPLTDGINVVFTQRASCCTEQGGNTVMITAAGEEVIMGPYSRFPPPPDAKYDYEANGGWAGFTQRDGSGVEQVWMRSPDGVTLQATRTQWYPAGIVAIGTNGELAYYFNGLVYVTMPPYTATAKVVSGRYYHRMEWRGGQLVAFLGRSAFTISY